MNAPLAIVNIPSLQMVEAELLAVLGNSIYPGAKPESIKLVIGYCRAANLDPMQKPVHIVPMDVKTDKKDSDGDPIYEKRDVIMPGIGLYRVNAARTDAYAGVSDPEFGPTQTLKYTADKWDDGPNGRRVKTKTTAEVDYPEWCKVTVRRIVQGHVVEFSAKELWKENYATAGKWSDAPNAMWKRRPFGQLGKCAEAQALRKAFPEVGAQPTAEEMEGKTMDGGETIEGTATNVPPAALIPQPQSKSGATPNPTPAPTNHTAERKPITAGALKTIKAQMANAALSDLDLKAKFGHDADGALIENWTLEALMMDQVNAVLEFIRNPGN